MKKFILALSFAVGLSNFCFSAVDPHIDWKKIVTAHFEIIYDAKQYTLARAYALRAEHIFATLAPHLKEHPEKTILILNDSTDLANGYATRIPYPHIMLYPVMPSSIDSISEYGDWAYELLLHEYVHILSFEPAHGIVRGVRNVFGTIITPTMLLPRWWLEGIAVEFETRFSKNGRLRSVLQDSALRSMEINDLYEKYDISEINESDISSWPRGARPYFFGALLMSELAQSKGVETLNAILNDQGSRIPYMIEGPLINHTELTYTDWFTQALLNTQIKVQKQLKQLRKKETTFFTVANIKGLENTAPVISPNGQYLALVNKNNYGKNSVKIFDRKQANQFFDFTKDEMGEVFQGKDQEKGVQKDAPPGGYISRISWLPDSSGFAFDKVVPADSYNNYSDIFVYSFKTKKTYNLTKAVRAREPDVSPDGKFAAFIHSEGGATSLGVTAIRNIEEPSDFKNNFQIVFAPPLQHRLSYPTFINNEELLFAWRDTDGNQFFYKINFKNKGELPSKVITGKLTQLVFDQQTKVGILFSANENGTHNIYIADVAFKNIQRLTHTETAAFHSTVDSRTNQLYTTLITSEGPKTHSTNLIKEALSAELPKISAIHADRYPPKEQDQILKAENLEAQYASLLKEPTEYSVWPELWPHYWFPFFYASGEGYGTQISTSSQDPLEKHSYLLQAGYDSYNSQTNGAFGYTNQSTSWPVILQGAISQALDPISKTEIKQSLAKAMITRDLKPWSDSLSWGLGVVTQRSEDKKGVRNKGGPELLLAYKNLTTSPFSTVPIGGWSSSLAYTHFAKNKDTQYGFDRGLLEGSFYHSRYLPEYHVAFMRYKGIYTSEAIPQIQLSDYTHSETTPLTNSILGSGFILRGYDTNYLVFKSAFNTTLEYGMLLSNRLLGSGTTPAFIKRTRLHFFTDALVAEGYEFLVGTTSYSKVKSSKTFLSYGAELKFDTTLGYYFPLSWVIGFYDRPQYSGKTKPTVFFSIQI
jgi:hypothetical protein